MLDIAPQTVHIWEFTASGEEKYTSLFSERGRQFYMDILRRNDPLSQRLHGRDKGMFQSEEEVAACERKKVW